MAELLPVALRALEGSPVRVHRNLAQRRGGPAFSILGTDGRLHGWTREQFVLTEVVFHVQPRGPHRVRERGHRDVHAWAAGTLRFDVPPYSESVEVTYNPFRDTTFVTVSHPRSTVSQAEAVLFSEGRVRRLLRPSVAVTG